MDIICVDPQTNLLWKQLIAQHPSDAFHSPEWMRVLRETYGFEVQAYILLDSSGQPKAGLPFCRIADIRGERIVTLPFSDYCDPLMDNYGHWHLLVSALLAKNCQFIIRCLHNVLPLVDDRLALIDKAKWHGLDLGPNLEAIWRSLGGATRRAIKKAERDGVTIHLARGKEDLRAFFELHLGVRKNKYGLLTQPYRFFENIWKHFIEKQKGVLMLAIWRDKIIGGVMFLELQEKLYYKFNASDIAYESVRPDGLLIWEGIKYAKSKNYTYLDFGLTDWDQEGLLRYKRKFATEEKTISFLRYDPTKKITQAEQQLHTLVSQLTELFVDQSVPDPVTEKASDMLYRFLV